MNLYTRSERRTQPFQHKFRWPFLRIEAQFAQMHYSDHWTEPSCCMKQGLTQSRWVRRESDRNDSFILLLGTTAGSTESIGDSLIVYWDISDPLQCTPRVKVSVELNRFRVLACCNADRDRSHGSQVTKPREPRPGLFLIPSGWATVVFWIVVCKLPAHPLGLSFSDLNSAISPPISLFFASSSSFS